MNQPGPTIQDIEGNTYNTVRINNQTWMRENLKTTKFNDGVDIPLVSDSLVWISLNLPGYCWYNNNKTNYKDPYGALYNWYVIDTMSNGNKKVCPSGWHVPSDEEWKFLINFLGGEDGTNYLCAWCWGITKEIGLAHWSNTNPNVNNSSGFTAVGSGARWYGGSFTGIRIECFLWSSSFYPPLSKNWAWYRVVNNDNSVVYRSQGPNRDGFAIPLFEK